MELDNHITQLGLQLQKLLERTEKGKKKGGRERERKFVSIVSLSNYNMHMPAQTVGTLPSQCRPILNLLVRTLLWRSCLSKEASAHRPPYTATAEGESSWERGGSDGDEGEGVRGNMGCVLTSEHLQCSKEACRNSLAATLYFLFSISASPAAHLSRVAISRLAGS